MCDCFAWLIGPARPPQEKLRKQEVQYAWSALTWSLLVRDSQQGWWVFCEELLTLGLGVWNQRFDTTRQYRFQLLQGVGQTAREAWEAQVLAQFYLDEAVEKRNRHRAVQSYYSAAVLL